MNNTEAYIWYLRFQGRKPTSGKISAIDGYNPLKLKQTLPD